MRKYRFRWNFFIWLILLHFLFLFTGLAAQPLSFEKITLENGLRVYYQQDSGIKYTTVVFHFQGGQTLERPGQSGLAYLTTRLMAEVAEEDRLLELLANGVNLNGGSRADYSAIQFECLSPHLERTLGTVAAGIRNPIFSGLRIDALKRALRKQSRIESCRLIDTGLILLRRQIFPGSPYGQSIYGFETDLASISRKDIRQFYENAVNASRLSLLVITDLEKKPLLEMISRSFSWLKKERSSSREEPVASDAPDRASEEKEIYNGPPGASVILGYVLPGEASRVYPAGYVLEKIIGQGPGSLLWFLRQEEALAYNLNCRLELLGGKTIFICYLETEEDKAETALSLLKKKFALWTQRGLEPEIVEAGRRQARTGYLRESLYRDNRLNFLSTLLASGLDVDFYNGFLDSIEKINPAELNHLVRSAFEPSRAFEVLLIKK